MRLLYLASNNRHKLDELAALIKVHFSLPFTLKLAKDLDPTVDWDETGSTFAENAAIKARVVKTLLGKHRVTDAAVLADDSGLEVLALGGAPGVHSSRYAGKAGDDAANNAKLLAALVDVADSRRGARFVCALHFIAENGRETGYRGECTGHIARVGRGQNGFGYDPLFVVGAGNGVETGGRTLAELTESEKNLVSHRRRATEAWLSDPSGLSGHSG